MKKSSRGDNLLPRNMKWSVRRMHYDYGFEELLSDGWEPFSATEQHYIDGSSDAYIYLRKMVSK